MKKWIVLALLTLCGTAVAADAPTATDRVLTPDQQDDLREIFSENYVPVGNGFDDLMAAYETIDLPSVSAAALSKDAAEKLRLSRIALQKNQTLLRRVRAGLSRGIARRSPLDLGVDPLNRRLRRLDDLFSLEGEIRTADGNFNGAVSSYLDALELGVASVNGGAWEDTLNGIERPARQKLKELAPKLDAATLQMAAQRLQAIEQRRVPVLDLWRNEKQLTLAYYGGNLPFWNEKSLREDGYSSKERSQILKMTQLELLNHITRRFDALMRGSAANYRTVRDTPLRSFDPYTDKYAPSPVTRSLLSYYLGNQTQSLLLRHAFELEAIHRETGAYPAMFATEIDPFDGEKPLIYRLAGDGYLLYSIGPDTKDDGGTAVSTIVTDAKSGVQTTSKKIFRDSTGDILGPTFQ